MRHLAMTGIEPAAMISRIFLGAAIRATPPSARICEGTRSSAMTATAPDCSAMTACSAVVTSIITPPFSISARPVFRRRLLGFPLLFDMVETLFGSVLFYRFERGFGAIVWRLAAWEAHPIRLRSGQALSQRTRKDGAPSVGIVLTRSSASDENVRPTRVKAGASRDRGMPRLSFGQALPL